MDSVNLLSFGIAGLIVGLYVCYLIFFSGKGLSTEKLNLEKRLNKGLPDLNKNEEIKTLSLLKAAPDTYFKSKLPKADGLKEWIQHSGLEIKPLIFVMLSIVVGFVFAVLCFFGLHTKFLITVLLGIVGAFFFPWVVVAFLTSQRKKHFLEDFPVALDTIRRALRAGHSIDRGLNMVVEQLAGPVGAAFKQMVEQLKIGRSFEDVLAEMSNRLGIDDFRMLAIVIILQQETGGSLAEGIDNFSKIIRARQQLRKKVKALTAEVRVTAMILTAIPFVIFGVVYLTTPTYFDPLFYTDRGQTVLIIGIVMLVAGIGIMARMTYKESY